MRLHNIIGLGINVAQIWPTSHGKKLCSFQMWAENIVFVITMLCRLFSIVYLSQTHICIYGLVCTNWWTQKFMPLRMKTVIANKTTLNFLYNYQTNNLLHYFFILTDWSCPFTEIMSNVLNRIYFYFCNLDSKDVIIKLTFHKDCQAVISKIREKDM